MQELLIKEEWRKVEDFPYYHVSSLGRIRSSNPFANKPRILSGSYSCRGGYQTVILTRYQDNKREKKCFTVHPLVARAFIGPRPAGYELHHKDGNPRNNAASNLEYVTSSENTTRAVDMGRWPVGSRRWNAVHSESEAKLVLELDDSGLRPAEIVKQTGLDMSFVCHVVRGSNWRHIRSLGRKLTQEVAVAELRRDWKRVDELIREKDRINRQLREAQCRQT